MAISNKKISGFQTKKVLNKQLLNKFVTYNKDI